MTRGETTEIIRNIRAAYPLFYRDATDDEAKRVVSVWQGTFADDHVTIVAAAVHEYIANDQKGYAPWPGAIKTIVRRLSETKKRFVKTGEDDAGCHTGYWVTES